MFWRFGGYANVSAVDAILEKPEFTLEELLEEGDLIQELKAHNAKLIEYLREEPVLERLLEYVVAPKVEPVASARDVAEADKTIRTEGDESTANIEEDQEEKEKKRSRYAYVAAEILSTDSWSLSAALLENTALLRKFWDFVKCPPPLDPLQGSYFTKVNEVLLDKKTAEMLDFLKSIDGVVKSMLQHVDSPMVMDLLLKIISLEKQSGGEGIVDWLHSQDLMPILLSFLSNDHSWAMQTSAGDFLKAIITISANASQNEQSCIGPNELTRQLVSAPCVEQLIKDMLQGGNPLTVGVGIVIEVIRKNNSDYDPEVGSEASTIPSSHDPIYLGTLLRKFAKHVPDFMALILSPNHTIGGADGPVNIRRKELSAAFGSKIEPLGFDRFKTCELMAELLHCSNMGLLNEVGSEEFVMTRDLEREKLKAEGKLDLPSPSRRNSADEDLTMKTSSSGHRGSESPEASRRLEVQNATDEDGFEEVNPSVDFDEKPDLEDYSLGGSQPEPLSFMDKDAEDFVDEPLTSPRFHLGDTAGHFQDPSMTVLPLSPSKELSQEVASLNVNKSSPGTDASDSVSLEALESGVGAENIAESEPVTHPGDMPAPLFAKKSEGALSKATDGSTAELSSTPEPVLDDTLASNDIVMRDTTEDLSQTEETFQAPVVGNYLKMQFVEHKVVPTIIDFFFRFPWNNFLHNVVYDVVQQVFNGPMDHGFNKALAVDLFDTGNITMRIVDGQRKSDEAQQNNRMRLGYMGHLTLIAEEVVKFTERHPPELLSESVVEKVMHGDWAVYVEVTLSETRERDNAILGGARPDNMGGRPGTMSTVGSSSFGGQSSALADAGLNGGTNLDGMDVSNSNGSTLGNTGGSNILSGFGSSSDEEDEEMEENEDEDVSRRTSGGAEFSRYITTPSTTTALSPSSEPNPPLNPPPPPPLNTPSAARRRLAARLAMKNQGSSSNQSSAFDSDQYPEEHAKNVNPFLTEDDEDEEDEDDAFGDFQDGRRGSINSQDDIDDLVDRVERQSGFEDDFTVGDLEVAAEGKGIIPPGSSIVGGQAPVEILLSNDGTNSSGESDSSSDDDDGDFGSANVGGPGRHAVDRTNSGDVNSLTRNGSGSRRKPSTTEAKRRTSLEDDDEEEEAIEVAREEVQKEEENDEDLVEVRHEEGDVVK